MRNMTLAGALILSLAGPAAADWALDNEDSSLTFVSTKANTAAEVHTFKSLDGGVDADGNVTLVVDLASVDTAIAIRDERMREMLFETERYPTATLAAQVDPSAIDKLGAGEQMTLVMEAQLLLRATTLSLTTEMTVARISESRLLVASDRPVIVNAGQVDLLPGVDKLREIAGLASISPAVPVSFVLAFDRTD